MIDSESLIPVGKLVATHGIRGMLKLHSYSGSVESLRTCDSVILRSRDGALNRFEPKPVLPRSGKFLIGFKGVDNIDQAQTLVGSEICLRRDQLPEPEEDEYYWCDLIGLEVATVEGMALGVIEEIFEAGSSDIYVVRGAGGEYLIPAIADVIHSVDLERGRMLITPLEGLLDL
jgi:16S rRNA processing protein RimM